MTTKYSSKIGIEFIGLILVILLPIFYFIVTDFKIGGFIMVIFIILFFIYLFKNTFYLINKSSNQLIVKSGFLVNIPIEIEKIKEIKSSKSLISSPALSIHRIEILYNTYDSVLISPKDLEKFIQELQQINPNIIYLQKTRN